MTVVCYNIGESRSIVASITGIKSIVLPTLFQRFLVPYGQFYSLSKEVRKSDVVHLMSHWTLLNVIIYFLTRWHGVKLFVCPAGSLNGLGRSRFLKILFNNLIGKRILRYATGRIVISASEEADIAELLGEEVSCSLIPNGIVVEDYILDNESDDFYKKFKIPKKPFILFLGRLNPIKGPDLLLEAFNLVHQKITDKNLVFAGIDQGMRSSLQKRAKDLGILSRIYFTGHILGRDKIMALNECEYMIIPSRKEAMSIVVLEAGASGKPVILTDKCGLDVLGEQELAVLTTTDPASIAEGIIQMEGLDREKMAKGFKSLVLENYSWSSIVREHLRVFQLGSPHQEA